MAGSLVGTPGKPISLKARDKQHARTRKLGDKKKFDDNWDKIFNKKEKVKD